MAILDVSQYLMLLCLRGPDTCLRIRPAGLHVLIVMLLARSAICACAAGRKIQGHYLSLIAMAVAFNANLLNG